VALWRDSAALVGLDHQATQHLTTGIHHGREDPPPRNPTPLR
jgi:hypothetical protein